jgi:phosphatidylinositol-3-phosphatase
MRKRLSIVVVAISLLAALGTAASASAALPPIKHVFIIVLENESASTTFAPGSAAPYLSQTLTSQGAFVPNYYGIGHNSLDNYIAMIGGQPPNPTTQADCTGVSNDVSPDTFAPFGASNGTGCQYPADVPTIANQLTSAGLSWGGYMDSMGSDPTREASVCAHPAVGVQDPSITEEGSSPFDQYATRHDPFVYYHSITDDAASCDSHVVNLTQLPQALTSVATTPNYVFITPGLCNDGHDTNCPNGQPGGLTSADAFLKTWVPQITASPAYKQDGLLLITFDEGVSDDSSCCGEQPGPAAALPGGAGPGGGVVGAVMLSQFIKPGTITQTAYNHYSMLGSIEDLFGLSHLGYAQLPGETDFGSDIYTNYPPPAPVPPIIPPTTPAKHAAPVSTLTVPALASTASARAQVTVRYSATPSGGTSVRSYDVQSMALGVRKPVWRTLTAATTKTSLTFTGTAGHTYSFRVSATDSGGQTGAFATSGIAVIPSGVKPAKGHYGKHWTTVKRKGAWLGHAIVSSTAGSAFTLRYLGGTLTLIGETTPVVGKLKVTLDGHSRTLRLHSSKLHVRQTLGTFKAKAGKHHLTLTVLDGTVALEGYGISTRTG